MKTYEVVLQTTEMDKKSQPVIVKLKDDEKPTVKNLISSRFRDYFSEHKEELGLKSPREIALSIFQETNNTMEILTFFEAKEIKDELKVNNKKVYKVELYRWSSNRATTLETYYFNSESEANDFVNRGIQILRNIFMVYNDFFTKPEPVEININTITVNEAINKLFSPKQSKKSRRTKKEGD